MRNIYFGVLIILLASCNIGSKNSRILKKDVFIDVLVDIHLTDGVITAKGLNVNRDSTAIKYYCEDVLKKHNITALQLDNTIKHYSNKTDEYDKIYDKVLKKLAIKEATIKENKKNLIIESEDDFN